MKTYFLKIAAISVVLASSIQAQLYIASGVNTGVVSQFTFSINSILNQVTVDIDNTVAGLGGVTGTLMSFGFNVPTIALANSGTLLSQNWTTLAAGHAVPANWNVAHPYDLSGDAESYVQDFGLYGGSNENGGNSHQGIWFGEAATFVFQFADLTSATGFLGYDGISARWQQVTAGEGSDKSVGGEDFVDLPPIPEPSTYGLTGAAVLLISIFFRRRLSKVSSRAA